MHCGSSRTTIIGGALLIALCILGACAAPSEPLIVNPLNRFTQLKPGISTVDDTQSLLGPAKSYSDVGGGRVLLQWHQETLVGVGWLAIVFSASDHVMLEVMSVTYN